MMEIAVTLNGLKYKTREMHSKRAGNALLKELGEALFAKTEEELIGEGE